MISERSHNFSLSVYAHVMPGMKADAAQRVANLVLEPSPVDHSAKFRPKSIGTKEKRQSQPASIST